MTADIPEQERRQTPVSVGDLIRRLDWRQELLSAAMILAEAALLYLVTGFLLAAGGPEERVLPAWIVVMLLLTAHFVPHLLDEWRVWSPEYEAVMAGAIGISLLLAIKAASFPQFPIWDIDWLRQTFRALALLPNDAVRPVWAIVALGAYAWWRGRSRAEASVDSAYAMLRHGTVILAVIIIVILAAASDTAQVRDRLSAGTVGFFVATLAAIGIARLRLEGFRTSSPLGPRWLATFVAPILAVVTVAIVGAGIFSRQFLDTILWMLTPLFWILGLVFQVFILVMAVLAYIILTPIIWLIGTREPRPLPALATPGVPDDSSRIEQVTEAPFQVPDPLRYLIAAIILFVIFSLLTRFVFRRRARERGATDEERESVLEWGDLIGGLGARVRGLFRGAEAEEDPLAGLRGDPRWQYTLAIRDAYRRLQVRGARIGRPRRISETADEYQPGLAGEFVHNAGAAEAIASLTDRYRRARYSGVPASAADAADAEDAWQRIERAAVAKEPG